tara:strand:+ start:52 stop:303 length:252 start_codon:yes stop_codon:yes gene_type:complete
MFSGSVSTVRLCKKGNCLGNRLGTATPIIKKRLSITARRINAFGFFTAVSDSISIIDYLNASPGFRPSFLRIIAKGQNPVKAA